MRRTTQWTGSVDELEGRALLSTMQGPGSVWSNPAVVADLAKIKTDTQTLVWESRTAAPTILADHMGFQTAIKSAIANDSAVKTAQATLKTDQTAAQTTLSKDWKAIWSAPNFSAAVAAAKVYWADAAAAAKTIAADQKAIQTAINADPGVVAAEAKLQADEAPITQDQMTLQADYTQLSKDIKAAHHS